MSEQAITPGYGVRKHFNRPFTKGPFSAHVRRKPGKLQNEGKASNLAVSGGREEEEDQGRSQPKQSKAMEDNHFTSAGKLFTRNPVDIQGVSCLMPSAFCDRFTAILYCNVFQSVP